MSAATAWALALVVVYALALAALALVRAIRWLWPILGAVREFIGRDDAPNHPGEM